MEGRDHETLTEPSTLAGEESILNPCMSNTSNAATERQDVVNQELFSEAEPTSEKESKPVGLILNYADTILTYLSRRLRMLVLSSTTNAPRYHCHKG